MSVNFWNIFKAFLTPLQNITTLENNGLFFNRHALTKTLVRLKI